MGRPHPADGAGQRVAQLRPRPPMVPGPAGQVPGPPQRRRPAVRCTSPCDGGFLFEGARMTTITTAPSSVREQVARLTHQRISEWQGRYLADDAKAVAALARLRRGAGRNAGQLPDLWELVDSSPLHERPRDARALSEGELSRPRSCPHRPHPVGPAPAGAQHRHAPAAPPRAAPRPRSRRTPAHVGGRDRRAAPQAAGPRRHRTRSDDPGPAPEGHRRSPAPRGGPPRLRTARRAALPVAVARWSGHRPHRVGTLLPRVADDELWQQPTAAPADAGDDSIDTETDTTTKDAS
ncbi:hypothetical protein SBADM41S_03769 [Streptomyces badius]